MQHRRFPPLLAGVPHTHRRNARVPRCIRNTDRAPRHKLQVRVNDEKSAFSKAGGPGFLAALPHENVASKPLTALSQLRKNYAVRRLELDMGCVSYFFKLLVAPN